jgi:hypothetical protein
VRSEVRRDSKLFRALTRSLLGEGISVRFQAQGRSMFPAIKDEEEVQVEPASAVRSGEVVLVESEDGLRAHRVISSGGALITQGDSCLEPETTPHGEAVLGRISRFANGARVRSPHTLRSRLRRWLNL